MMPRRNDGNGGHEGTVRSRLLKLPGSVRESGGAMTLLTIAGSVILVAALAAVPQRGPRGQGQNPAADAEAIRRTLAIQAGELPDAGKATPAASDSPELEADTTPRFRDLFNPVRTVRQAPARRAVAAPPRLPHLSGVFLDGGNRAAVLNGGTVAEGGMVGGFHVHAIRADKVVLEVDGQLYTLDWKGVQP